MSNLKPKEPLLAVMFTMILTGLGQIYAGKIKRGILFFLIPLIMAISLMFYLFNPNTKTNLFLNPATNTSFLLLLLAILGIGYGIFVIIDAHRCAKIYNINNNLTRKITILKKILIITGIIFFAFIACHFNKMLGVGIASYIRNDIAQAFSIPSTSMEPTLLAGDRFLADKAIYKKSEPKRGDIIVFMYPEDTKKIFVMRLVGLPEETVEIKNGSLLINGTIVKDSVFEGKYYYNKGDYAKEGQAVKIPADNYFVLGDNSDRSRDSRYWGFVPKNYILGKAYKIFYPFNRSGPIK